MITFIIYAQTNWSIILNWYHKRHSQSSEILFLDNSKSRETFPFNNSMSTIFIYRFLAPKIKACWIHSWPHPVGERGGRSVGWSRPLWPAAGSRGWPQPRRHSQHLYTTAGHRACYYNKSIRKSTVWKWVVNPSLNLCFTFFIKEEDNSDKLLQYMVYQNDTCCDVL